MSKNGTFYFGLPMSLFRILAIVIGGLTGVLVFLQYFIDSPVLTALAQPLLEWSILLTAAALVLAALFLAVRHIREGRRQPLSLLLLAGFAIALVAGLLPSGFTSGAGRWVYQWTLGPGLAAVFALLPVFLAVALWRHLRAGSIGLLLLAIGLILALLGQTPYVAEHIPAFALIRHNLLVGPTAAAFRGVLIGLALGVVIAVVSRLRLSE